MRIAYYTDQVYLHGGIEKVLAQKLNYLALYTNHEVYLITTEQKGKKHCYHITDNIKHHDLGVNYIRSKSYFSLRNLEKVPKHIYRLREKLKKINPDVLIVCNYAFDFYFIPFICSGVKTVKEFHSSRYYYAKGLPNTSLFNKKIHQINNWVATKYNHLVLLNEDEKKYYHSDNLVVIPNAIAQNPKKEIIKRKNIIIAAGRIAPVKQFDHLIKSWALIAKKHPTWEVHIYGEGDKTLSKSLAVLIMSLNIPNIYIKGVTNILETKMHEASLYALTSATECFPMVLLEALNCGLPIISYDCPHGPRNIITNNKDGILITHNNITAFAKELSKLIDNTALRNKMKKNGLKNISRFNEENIMPKWLQLFKNK